MRLSRNIAVVTLALLAAFPAMATAPALADSAATPASAPVARPAAGISDEWNEQMCAGNGFERIKTPQTEYTVSDSAGTCVTSERYHAVFSIAKVTKQISWQFPNIASGYTPEGEATCASSADTCFTYPVRQEDDGTPLASFSAWLNPGQYDLAFDIYFSPTEGMHATGADRNGDTEVMIWYAHPGLNETRSFNGGYVTIGGIRFGVMTWRAGRTAHWRYIAYVAMSGPGLAVPHGKLVTFRNQWLNPFFRNVESRGYLSKTEWLQSIDLGFELVKNGTENNIHNYTLADVR